LNAFTFSLDDWFGKVGVGQCLEHEVVNVFVNEFAFVNKTITEPDVYGVEPGDITENVESHFFADFTHRGLAVTLAVTDMALGKSPLAVAIHDHRKIDRPALAFEHQSSGRDFGAMPFTLAATFARGD
jgi:hypothetical protein